MHPEPIRLSLTPHRTLAGIWDAKSKQLHCCDGGHPFSVYTTDFLGEVIGTKHLVWPDGIDKDELVKAEASFHPTEPLVAVNLSKKALGVWNYKTGSLVSLFKATTTKQIQCFDWLQAGEAGVNCIHGAMSTTLRGTTVTHARNKAFIGATAFRNTAQGGMLIHKAWTNELHYKQPHGKGKTYSKVAGLGMHPDGEKFYLAEILPAEVEQGSSCGVVTAKSSLNLVEYDQETGLPIRTIGSCLHRVNHMLEDVTIIPTPKGIFITELGQMELRSYEGELIYKADTLPTNNPIISPDGGLFYGLMEGMATSNNASIILFQPPRPNPSTEQETTSRLETPLDLV